MGHAVFLSLNPLLYSILTFLSLMLHPFPYGQNKPTAGRTKTIHRRLELSFNLYLLLLFVGQNRASKSLLHITPGFSASCSFSTNKTFEGQLKPSKPFSYRRFSWLTLCGCQARNKKNLQKNKPYKGFSRFRTDLSLVGLTCALYVLFLIMIMLHGHPFCYAAD